MFSVKLDYISVLLSSSSIHYRHNGGDARKAHMKHPVPSITATMED